MTLTTYAQRRDAVRNAIEQILLTGEEQRIGDKSYKMSDIEALHRLEVYYTDMAAREERGRGGIRVQYGVVE